MLLGVNLSPQVGHRHAPGVPAIHAVAFLAASLVPAAVPLEMPSAPAEPAELPGFDQAAAAVQVAAGASGVQAVVLAAAKRAVAALQTVIAAAAAVETADRHVQGCVVADTVLQICQLFFLEEQEQWWAAVGTGILQSRHLDAYLQIANGVLRHRQVLDPPKLCTSRRIGRTSSCHMHSVTNTHIPGTGTRCRRKSCSSSVLCICLSSLALKTYQR